MSMVQCLWPRPLIVSPSIHSLLSFLAPKPLIFKYRVLGLKTVFPSFVLQLDVATWLSSGHGHEGGNVCNFPNVIL